MIDDHVQENHEQQVSDAEAPMEEIEKYVLEQYQNQAAQVPTLSKSEAKYQKNLALIAGSNPELAAQINEMPITGVRMLSSSESTDVLIGQVWNDATQKWVQVCADDDPITQAKNDVQEFYNRDVRVFTLLGHGLGYVSVELAKKLEPHQRMAIFEASPSLWKASMYAVDLEHVLSDRKIDTIIGDGMTDKATQWYLSLQSHEKFNILPPIRCGYTMGFRKEEYDALGMQCIEMMRYHAVGISTWKKFGQLIGENDLKNLPEYLLNPGFEELAGKWEGKPAVCLAAGPSLKKNLKHLLNPEVRKRVAVLCVGTIYPVVKGLGIEPDIVTTIDFQRLNYTDQFAHLELPTDTALVYLHSTYPDTVRRWPGPKFVALNASDTVNWFSNKLGFIKANAAQAQTVAHLNVICAQMLRADPIILLGQDLSMPADAHHAPGAGVQDQSPNQNYDAHVEAEDIYGNIVWSRHSFLSMRTVFTRLATEKTSATYLNCTEGGINIDGWANMTLHDAINTHILPKPIVQRLLPQINDVYQAYQPEIDWDKIITATEELETQLLDMVPGCKAVLDYHKKWKKARKAENSELAEEFYNQISASGEAIERSPMVVALLSLRDLDVIGVVARIMPEDEDDNVQKEYIINRLVDLSKLFIDMAPEFHKLLQETQTRLNLAQSSMMEHNLPYYGEAYHVHKLILHHFYKRALEVIIKNKGSDNALKFIAHIYKRLQLYTVASEAYRLAGDSKMERWCIEKHAASTDRINRHTALYFETTPELLTETAEVKIPEAVTNIQ